MGGAPPNLRTPTRTQAKSLRPGWRAGVLGVCLLAQVEAHGAAQVAPDAPSAEVAVATNQPGLRGLTRAASPLPTPMEERARVSVALAHDLESSLRSLPGVQEARVHLLAPATAPSPLGDPAGGKASVLLLLKPEARPVDAALVRNLVAGAVPDLAAEAVTVVQTPSSSNAAQPTRAQREQPTEPQEPRATRWILAVVLLSQLLLAAGTLVLLRRVRSVEALTRR